MPVRLTVWTLALALSLIDNAPVRVPLAAGVKVTEIEQFAPAAKDEPQLLVSVKFPLAVTLLMLIAVVPVFVKVTD